MKISVPNLFDKDPLYVKGMTEHAQLDETMSGLVSWGTPNAADNSGLYSATAIIPGQTLKPAVLISAHFGRTVNVTSTAAGAVTIVGRDYLNQRMTESVTCINGTVATAKAFKYVDEIVSVGVTGNVSLGRGPKLGLPFCASKIIDEYLNGAAGTVGTLTAPVATLPSATTGDVRGTYAPNATMNGTNVIEATVRFNQDAIDGLFGQKQA